MKPTIQLQWMLFLLVLGMLLALPVAGQIGTPTYTAHLPLVAHDSGYGATFSIWGRHRYTDPMVVTLELIEGERVTGVFTTTATGTYRFAAVPVLEAGQHYRVSYYNGHYGNPDNPDHLTIWHSFPITHSVAHSDTYGGYISEERIVQRFPSDGRQYANLYPVEWQNRGILHFAVNIYDLDGVLLYETPDLWMAKEHTFNPLPTALSFNTPYLWEVKIVGPHGYTGIDERARREITFVDSSPLETPTGLTRTRCEAAPVNVFLCFFDWEPVEGATEYYFFGGWISETSGSHTVRCGSGFSWSVKARSDTAEGGWSSPVTEPSPGNCQCQYCDAIPREHPQREPMR